MTQTKKRESCMTTSVVLPPNEIVIVGGRVVRVAEWTAWAGMACLSLQIGREIGVWATTRGEFFSRTGNPEAGGEFRQGALDHVIGSIEDPDA